LFDEKKTKIKQKKTTRNKMKKLSQFFEGSYLENTWFEFGMRGDDVGQHFHRKNQLVSLKCHRAMYT